MTAAAIFEVNEASWDDVLKAVPLPMTIRSKVVMSGGNRVIVSEICSTTTDFRAWSDECRAYGKNHTIEVVREEELDFYRGTQDNSQSQQGETKETIVQQQAMQLMQEAAHLHASDIHFELTKNHAEIEFRLNGDMIRQKPIPREDALAMLPAIMNTMAGEGINMYKPLERQDTRISRERFLPENCSAIRIASGPLANDGRYMVLRLLYKDGDSTGDGSLEDRLKGLGYTDAHIEDIRLAWDRPSGINIIAGPTGSGKSTTLKHILEAKKAESPEENFISVEDPPEYKIKGVRQIPVSATVKGSSGRSEAYADVIRYCLRSDPDKMLVGEIRDRESLRAAVEAAQTGHGVSASLHANSAFGIIQRTFDLMRSAEIPDPSAVLADETIITGLIFQRLVKTNCSCCAIPILNATHLIRPALLERVRDVLHDDQLSAIKIMNPDGCDACGHTGTTGRTVVAEVVVTDAQMMELLRYEGVLSAKRYWRDHLGGKTIYDDTIAKMLTGAISPDNAERAIGPINTDHLNDQRRQEMKEQET